MQDLFEAWEEVKLLVKDRFVVLFLDYDGTLTPIVARPSMARLTPNQKKIIREFSGCPDMRLAIISGRELKDLKKCIGVSGMVYVGNHGLEIEGPQIKHTHPTATEFRQLANKLNHRLRLAFAFLPEILIEDKTYSVGVHYRQVPEDKIEFVKMILFKEIGSYLGKGQVVVREGKKVWEIRPPTEWNKGKTVLWFLGRAIAQSGKRALPVYVGDDVTDEDAFRALQHRGITVKVAEDLKQSTEAEYFVRSPEEVFDFLKRLIEIKTESAVNSQK